MQIGKFYWVVPANDPDFPEGQEWMAELQPARLAGFNEDGEPRFQFIGVDLDEDFYPVKFVGPELAPVDLLKKVA